jgi:acyl dehydratase
MLGVDDVRWVAPVACGDTIGCEIEIVEARPSRSPDRGVVVMQHRVVNQEGVVVLTYSSARLVATRSQN